jgi:hypothetical protein
MDGASMEVIEALLVVMRVCQKWGMDRIVVTSVNDGKHKIGSHHYLGYAVDLRNYDWPDSIGMADEIRAKLHPDFDVVIELDHLHIEYDPKP